jgi:protoheme IX farnesyltransferase
VPMLPVTHGVPFTAGRILGYTLGLVAITLVPAAIGMSGWLYLAAAVPLGARFVVLAWRLRADPRLAMPTFRFSILYLFGLFAALLADHYARMAGWVG